MGYKKLVYVCVRRNPKETDNQRLAKLNEAEEAYLAARGLTREDVDFMLDYWSGDTASEEERPELVDLSDTIRALSLCDEAVVGVGWTRTMLAKTVSNVCITYHIPIVWVYKDNGLRNEDPDHEEKFNKWCEKHQVTVIYR